MPTANNIYSYCVDYTAMSSCLFTIQDLYDQGELLNYPELLELINELEQAALKKLYNRTIVLYGIINNNGSGQSLIEGDFNREYSAIDFKVALFVDDTNQGFSSRFKTIVNIFEEFCKDGTITEHQRVYIDEALSVVLDLFDRLQEKLDLYGFNPCGNLFGAYRNNSQFIHVQASGSTGSNGVAAGVHLRWSLDGHLGDNHFPQGSYANNLSNLTGYRKADDFVFVHRTPYENKIPVLLDFETVLPVIDSANFSWSYIINSSTTTSNLSNRIKLGFKDGAAYLALLATIDPLLDPLNFLKGYDGMIELESVGKTFFSAKLDFRKPSQLTSANLKIECLGKIRRGLNFEEIPVIRKSLLLTYQNSILSSITGENLSIIRLKKDVGSYVKSFEFETYHDFLETREISDWTELGSGFALSLEDGTVEERLEKPGVYDVDHLWPHYNEGTTVKIANYIHRWKDEQSLALDPPLKSLVSKYLELSETNPRAIGVLSSIDDPNAPGLEISYLDGLNVMAVDYHIARMFGLGHIDVPIATNDTKWLYRVSYRNKKNELSNQLVTHEYLTLPTSREDDRLPAKPSLRALKYTLSTQGMSGVFDELGYSKVDRVRVVNIGRRELDLEILDEDFWSGKEEEWNIFEQPTPVLYGIEYRSDSDVTYIKPEITANDVDEHLYCAYDDELPSGEVPESIPVPDHQDSLYTHFEINEGIHHYAVYGISIFSRVSSISDEVSTDETLFPVRNKLSPPTDIDVQYIQEEETLLFTTALEQGWLASREILFPNADVSFTRVSFNWIDLIDVSDHRDVSKISIAEIPKAKTINAYFKPDNVFEVRGTIVNVETFEGVDDQAVIEIESFTIVNGVRVPFVIPSASFDSIAGSWMSTQSGLFEIISLEEQASNVVLIIKKQVVTEHSGSNKPGEFNNDSHMVVPAYGEYFSFTENMALASQWESITNHIEVIDLSEPNEPVIETDTDDMGNEMHFLIGGLSAEAIVTPLDENNDQLQDLPGYYHVKFASGVTLSAHPQINLPYDPSDPGNNNPSGIEKPHVEWYKGYVRVPYSTMLGRKKLVQVLRIVSLSPLELIVYDPVEREDPQAILISEDAEDLIAVNFHPGYRAYFFSEPTPEKFNSAHLAPAPTENDRKVLLALQSSAEDLSSRISTPTTFIVRKITKTVQMEEVPIGRLRVRPDARGNAAFTFDRKFLPESGVARAPFGFMFFRISLPEVLEALYITSTIETILTTLADLQQDNYSDQRFYELVNLIYDPNNPGHFKKFGVEPESYGFPDPDKPGLIKAGDNELKKLENYRAAIRKELLPLTEQPPIFSYIKLGQQTENTAPVIRDKDGNILSGEEFNPFPMVRKFMVEQEPGVWYIRFSDYTLKGASRFLYFYTAAEITNQLVIGPLSSYTGPVEILNTGADLPPNIVSYEQFTTGVRFTLAPLSQSEAVNKIRVYRSKFEDELSILNGSTDFVDVDFDVLIDDSLVLDDNLDGMSLGSEGYFRLATVRVITNEFYEQEQVVSKPSEIISISLIDSSNPEAPEISYVAGEQKLKWQPTVVNGTYYLFRQTKTGNWQQVNVTYDNSQQLLEYDLPWLPTTDEDGNRIYHRFKVSVQNSSGLFNLIEKELTI